MSLREWSVWRIVAVWLGWPLFLAALGVAAIAVALWRDRPPLPPGATALPVQGSDFAVALPPGSSAVTLLALLGLLVLGPPALVTGLWLWQRGRRGAGPA